MICRKRLCCAILTESQSVDRYFVFSVISSNLRSQFSRNPMNVWTWNLTEFLFRILSRFSHIDEHIKPFATTSKLQTIRNFLGILLWILNEICKFVLFRDNKIYNFGFSGSRVTFPCRYLCYKNTVVRFINEKRI